MTTRLCGEAKDKGVSSTPKPSYNDISHKTTGSTPLPQAYIVERTEKIPMLELEDPIIEGIMRHMLLGLLYAGLMVFGQRLLIYINGFTHHGHRNVTSPCVPRVFLWFYLIILKTVRWCSNLVPGFTDVQVSLSLCGFQISTQINYWSPEHRSGSDYWIYPFIYGVTRY